MTTATMTMTMMMTMWDDHIFTWLFSFCVFFFACKATAVYVYLSAAIENEQKKNDVHIWLDVVHIAYAQRAHTHTDTNTENKRQRRRLKCIRCTGTARCGYICVWAACILGWKCHTKGTKFVRTEKLREATTVTKVTRTLYYSTCALCSFVRVRRLCTLKWMQEMIFVICEHRALSGCWASVSFVAGACLHSAHFRAHRDIFHVYGNFRRIPYATTYTRQIRGRRKRQTLNPKPRIHSYISCNNNEKEKKNKIRRHCIFVDEKVFVWQKYSSDVSWCRSPLTSCCCHRFFFSLFSLLS